MSPTTPTLASLACALGITERDLLALLAAHSGAHDPTLVALTVEEAARRLGVGRTTMYALISSGVIPSVTIGRLRRVPAGALDDYVAARLATTDVALAA